MQCLCASARQVARRLTRLYEAELSHAGMNPAQFELLVVVQGRAGSSQTELAAAMDVDQTTLSRNLKLLLVKEWVAAGTGKDDRRRVEYCLTHTGERALREAIPHWKRATEHVQSGLGAEAEAVWGVLERLSIAAEHTLDSSTD